jgi:hypothetical protein
MYLGFGLQMRARTILAEMRQPTEWAIFNPGEFQWTTTTIMVLLACGAGKARISGTI